MKRKNDKVVMLLIFMIAFAVLSWFIGGSMYNNGTLESVGMVRAGLYDLFLVVYSAFYYRAKDILFIFLVGGCYGVLSQTNGYKKLVDKTSSLIKGKEIIALGIVLFLMSAYVSVSNEIFALFCFSPFIISVFLKSGCDRLTAISAGFGGMFVGYLGLTVGTFGLSYLNEATGLGVTEWITVKIILFVIAYVLYFIFAALHIRSTKKVDEVKYDMFKVEELEEISKAKKIRVFPTALIFIFTAFVVMAAYISWVDSFGLDVFTNLHTSFTKFLTVKEVAVPSAIIGNYMTGFGEWSDLLGVSFVFIISTIILVIIDRMNINMFTKYFGLGCKRISKVAFIYGFAFITLFLCSSYPWPTTLIDNIMNGGTFNIVLLLIAAVVAHVFTGEPGYCGYAFGSFLSVAFVDDIIAATIVWRLGAALAFIIAPTSYLLLSSLTYVDVPYTGWIKYIWKFVLSFVLASLVVMAIVCYM